MEQGSFRLPAERRGTIRELIEATTAEWEREQANRARYAPLVQAVEAIAVGLGLALLYFVTLAGSNAEPDDGLALAVDVRNGASAALFDPSHLLYGWLALGADSIARALGSDAGPLHSMQLLNVVLGAGGVALLWLFLRRTIRNGFVAIGACGLVAFSYGYWFYSVSAEVYMLSALLLILTLVTAFRAAVEPSRGAFALVGLANGLAVLGHTVNVLFAAVALAALLIAMRRIDLGAALRCGFAYGAAAVATVLPAYVLAAAVIGLDSPRAVYEWYTVLARNGDWGLLGPESLPKAAIGAGRAFIGGHALLALGPVGEMASRMVPGQAAREELYLVRNVSAPLALLLVVPIAAAMLGVAASVYAWLRRPRLPEGAGVLALLCAAWLLAFVPFFVWWEPLNIEFWITPLIPAGVLLAFPLADTRRRWRRWNQWRPAALGVALGGLLLANLLGSVLLQTEDNDYWRARSSWYEANVSSSDLVITSSYTWRSYLRYFTPAEVVDLEAVTAAEDATVLESLAARIDAVTAAGGRVFVSGEAFYPEAPVLACCEDAAGATGPGAVLRNAYRDRLTLIERGREWVWQIEAK